MTLVMPEGTPTLGAVKVKVTASIANRAAPSLATEINAGAAVDISCHLLADGWMASAETAKNNKKRRLCSVADTEQLGVTTYRVAALRYIHDPQAADAATNNEARNLLKQGLKFYFVERHGKDAQTVAFATTQRVRSHYLVLGPQIEMPDPDDNGEFYIYQEVSYVSAGAPVVGTIAA